MHLTLSAFIFNLSILISGICALVSALNFVAEVIMNDWKNKPGVRTIYAMTMFTFITSLGMLSIFPHQEPRFLIPLTVPIVLMNAHRLRWKFGTFKPFMTLWYIFNISLAVFFGLFHQAGVLPAVNYIGQTLETKADVSEVNFVWSHTYMPPTFELLRISEKSKKYKEIRQITESEFPSYYIKPGIRQNFHDLAGKDLFTDVKNEVLQLATRAKLKKDVENYIVTPPHILAELAGILHGSKIKFEPIAHFYPHISLEALPDISEDHLSFQHFYNVISSMDYLEALDIFVHFFGHFGLSLYKFDSISVETTVNIKVNTA